VSKQVCFDYVWYDDSQLAEQKCLYSTVPSSPVVAMTRLVGSWVIRLPQTEHFGAFSAEMVDSLMH